MSSIAIELFCILLLLCANGLFSMAEIAIVSARKPRLRQLAEGGNHGAQAALDLGSSPNTFLSTVQIGITLIGVLAAAYSDASLTDRLAAGISTVPALKPHAQQLGFAIVVTLLTFFTLIIGELAPKRLGLGYSERIACALAPLMRGLSRVTRPAVALLGLTTEGLLSILRIRPSQEAAVTEEDVRLLVREGMRAGVLHPGEPAMIDRVMALDEIPVRQLMTPRAKMIWINLTETHETIWHKIVVSGHTFYPVYEGTRDHVVGMLSVKAVYANLAAGADVRIKDLMTPLLVVPGSQPAASLLETFKKTGRHVALVADEFGGISGLVSLHDIMEAIIGEIPTPDERSRPRAIRRDDGSWLVDGMMPIDQFERAIPDFKLHAAADRDYQTFAGFIVRHLGCVPEEGESFSHGPYHVEIIDMDSHRVDKILLMPQSDSGKPSPPGPSKV
jgi:putative hemolysin